MLDELKLVDPLGPGAVGRRDARRRAGRRAGAPGGRRIVADRFRMERYVGPGADPATAGRSGRRRRQADRGARACAEEPLSRTRCMSSRIWAPTAAIRFCCGSCAISPGSNGRRCCWSTPMPCPSRCAGWRCRCRSSCRNRKSCGRWCGTRFGRSRIKALTRLRAG